MKKKNRERMGKGAVGADKMKHFGACCGFLVRKKEAKEHDDISIEL